MFFFIIGSFVFQHKDRTENEMLHDRQMKILVFT